MNSIVRGLFAVTLVVGMARPAEAQSIHDFAAWLAMMSTPYGSLPPVVTRWMSGQSTGAPRGNAFELRYGHFSLDNESDAVHIDAWSEGWLARYRGTGVASLGA